MHANFIHLRTYSSYSLSEGAIKIEDIISLAKKEKMPAICVSDRNNLFCSLEFSLEAVRCGIQPIVGCNIRINLGLDGYNHQNNLDEILLIAMNEIGYRNLVKLVSVAYIKNSSNSSPHINYNDIVNNSDGIIALTAGVYGTIGRYILSKNYDMAHKAVLLLQKIFADRLYIEIMRHDSLEENIIEPILLDMAYKYNIALVATNNVYFSDPTMYEAHDALLCISEGRYVLETDRRKSNHNWYFKSSYEMQRLFEDLPEAIENTINIAKRCCYIVEENAPMLPKFSDNEDNELRIQALKGLKERLELCNNIDEEEYYKRLEYELSVIINMKFPGYFLIVSDFIKWSKNNGIPVGPGRGSGAGSIVAWSLYITDLDPIRFGLIFERFLNPERVSMPDFDIDFCQERRDEVIDYVREKYGDHRVAHIITFGKLQAKAVIRDVGRVLQIPYMQVDKISKMVPFNAVNPINLSQAINMEPMLRNAREKDPQIDKLLSIALKLEGLHRHASTHAAGVVISEKPLQDIVPLYIDNKSKIAVIQYSMKFAEKAGLIKFDFLGLKTLTLIDNTFKLIEKRGIKIDPASIELNDRKTYEMLSNGKSTGVFQFESSGMKDALRRLKPDVIEDLIALGALYRPGPMDNIPIYIACKHGLQKPDYLHPKLEKVLKETYGVIVYQEQVLQIAQVLAGYSLGSADILRKAMGKKIKEEMDAQRENFINGAIKNGLDKFSASNIFDLVAKFAGYGFNKPHAAAYAIISYQTAYLKAHYTIEFLTASMNLELSDTEKLNIFINEAKSFNIDILPPDINCSGAEFSIEKIGTKTAIRYGLAALKNVGFQSIQSLIDERSKNGYFKDIFDLSKRCDSKLLNKRQLESLIKSGVFDSISDNRSQLFNSIDIIMAYNISENKNRKSNQLSLFSEEIYIPSLPDINDWSNEESLKYEHEAIGFYLKNHPLDSYADFLEIYDIKTSEFINTGSSFGICNVTLSGVVLSVRTKASVRGKFAYVTMSDRTGTFEISIFDNNLLERSMDLLNMNIPLCVVAELRKDEGGIKLTANKIISLSDYLDKIPHTMKIWITKYEAISKIKEKCNIDKKGKTKLLFNVLTCKKIEVEIELSDSFDISHKDKSFIESIDGVKKLVILPN